MNSGIRSGVIYDRGMGEIQGGQIEFKPGGRIHHSVWGYPGSDGALGGRFSWDTHAGGSTGGTHFTDQGYPKGNPLRHPFGS